jgi:hypothetical protein
VSNRGMARARGMECDELGASGWERSELGAGARVPHTRRKRRGQGKEAGRNDGAGCAYEAWTRRRRRGAQPSVREERRT